MRLPAPSSGRRPRIEIIPLIDVMFFLLATFMMVSLSMIRNKGIPVHLPSASTAKPQDLRDPSFVTVTEAGDFYFNREAVTPEQLKERILGLRQISPDPAVFVSGDRKAPLEKFLAAVDVIRSAGVTKIAFQTQDAPLSP